MIRIKCDECGSSHCFVDAEEDLFWCKNCGHIIGVDYRAVPGSPVTCQKCEKYFLLSGKEARIIRSYVMSAGAKWIRSEKVMPAEDETRFNEREGV